MRDRSKNTEDDDRKAFLGRVPKTLDEESLFNLLQKEFGNEVISKVSMAQERSDEDENGNTEKKNKKKELMKTSSKDSDQLHKGFGFVTFSSVDAMEAAIKKGSVRWDKNSGTKKRKKVRTIFIESLNRERKPENKPTQKKEKDGNVEEIKEKTKVESGKGKKRKGRDKKRQPLSVRVFGLNYDTTEEQVREHFSDCGPIMELTFPKFEDSGRSKGFCGVLFQSPKAVEKAEALNGLELNGRWLSIQAGKMYLKKWQENIENVQREKEEIVGEFGQKVKKRKRHGFKS